MRKAKRQGGTYNVAASLIPLLMPIGHIRVDKDNTRLHPERSIEAIRASLRRYGQHKPITVDGADPATAMRVLAGTGRLMAAQAEGWTHIAVVRLMDDPALSPEENRARKLAYRMADNKTAEISAWNPCVLAQKLDAFGPDVAAAVGFSEEERQELADALARADSGDDGEDRAAPAVPLPVVTIVFDDAPQKAKVDAFLKLLGRQYPNVATSGARFAAYLNTLELG